eukprot:4830703-Alexandrium_andersonii.AAC.1
MDHVPELARPRRRQELHERSRDSLELDEGVAKARLVHSDLNRRSSTEVLRTQAVRPDNLQPSLLHSGQERRGGGSH